MAAFRPNMIPKRVILTTSARKVVFGPQCSGITRRGTRCRRSVTASNLPGQSGKANLANYCKIHLRVNLNNTLNSNPGNAAKKTAYTGPSSRAVCMFYFFNMY